MHRVEVGAELPGHAGLFAGAFGDHHPVHVDLDVANSVGLDDVFSHGMLLGPRGGPLVLQRRCR